MAYSWMVLCGRMLSAYDVLYDRSRLDVGVFLEIPCGDFSKLTEDAVGGVFSSMLDNPLEMGIFMTVIVLAGFLVLSFGVQNGLEKVTKVMMLGLLGLILVLVINSFTLKKASEGISFYLLPNLDNIKHVGIVKVITAAMNQAFFTLSIGIASMEVFGSYMSDENTIIGEAVKICSLDTFVAIASGFIIFPACFSFGIQPAEGPSLIFVTLPCVFINMTGGRIWGLLFFLFMTFASFSTVTAVFENLVSSSMDNFEWGRTKSVIINCVIMLIASLPCMLGYNILKDVHLIGGRDILDSEDFIVSNLLLPIGALVFLMFCITKYGWGADKFMEETNKGEGMKLSPKLVGYFKYVLPVLIIVILISGLIK